MELGVGVHENISFEQYLEIKAVNNSTLSKLRPVPACALLPNVDTADKYFGHAFHTYVLDGPSVFFAKYAVSGKKPDYRKTKALAKEIADYERFLRDNADKQIIDNVQYATIKSMAEAIAKHPTANDFLNVQKGRNELTIIWDDEDTGQRCKGRIDRLIENRMIDLKSTRSAEIYIYRKDTIDYGSARAGIFYWEGLMRAGGPKIEKVSHVVCEKTPPYRVECYSFAMDFLDAAYDDVHRLLKLWKKCNEENFFPHYINAGEEELLKPAYYGDPEEAQ